MTGFKPGSSGTGSDRAVNCVTTAALICHLSFGSSKEMLLFLLLLFFPSFSLVLRLLLDVEVDLKRTDTL